MCFVQSKSVYDISSTDGRDSSRGVAPTPGSCKIVASTLGTVVILRMGGSKVCLIFGFHTFQLALRKEARGKVCMVTIKAKSFAFTRSTRPPQKARNGVSRPPHPSAHTFSSFTWNEQAKTHIVNWFPGMYTHRSSPPAQRTTRYLTFDNKVLRIVTDSQSCLLKGAHGRHRP